MKDVLPTVGDVQSILYKTQRQKNVLPKHAVLTREMNREIVVARGMIKQENDPALKLELEVRTRDLLQEKRRRDDVNFERIRSELEAELLRPRTSIRLKYRLDAEGKRITTFAKNREALTLLDRYVSLKLATSYRIQTRGRDQCIRILSNIFETSKANPPSKQGIHKVDIEDFFGSISHEILTARLLKHSGVPHFARRYVGMILDGYRKLHGKDVGIPRGIPSSSVLSEIYLEPLDSALRRNPDVVLYLRYVDDIILVCDPSKSQSVFEQMSKELQKLGLVRNELKSDELLHPSPEPSHFDYLGYRYSFSGGKTSLISVDISEAKLDRYKKAIDRLSEELSNTCLGTQPSVEFLIRCIEYLLYPHASGEGEDGQRIVTGLAYSSRFMTGPSNRRPHFKELLAYTVKKLNMSMNSAVAPKLSDEASSCKCCGQVVVQRQKLHLLLSKGLTESQVLESHALPHEADEVRTGVRRQLWK